MSFLRYSKKIISFCLVAAVLLTAGYVFFSPQLDLQQVKQCVYMEPRLYGIDEKGGQIRLFSCDADGGNAKIQSFDTRQLEKNRQYHLENFTMERVGVFDMEFSVSDLDTGNTHQKVLVSYDSEKKEILSQEKLPISAPEENYLQKEVNGGLWCVDRSGNVWKETDGKKTALFMNDGSRLLRNNTAYTFGQDGLYFYNILQIKYYKIPYDTETLIPAEQYPFDGYLQKFGKISNLQQMTDGTWTATFCQPDSFALPMVLGESEHIISRLYQPWWEIMLIGICFFALCCIIVQGIHFLKNLINNGFSTIIRIGLLSVVMLVIGSVLLHYQMFSFALKEKETETITRLYYQGDLLQSKWEQDDQTEKNWLATEEEFSKALKRAYQNEVPYDSFLWNQNVWIYQYDQGNLYKIERNGLYSVPMEYSMTNQEIKNLHICLDKKLPLAVSAQQSSNGEMLELYIPIYNEQGVLQVIFTMTQPEYQIQEMVKEEQNPLFIKSVIGFATIALLLLLLFFFFLRPMQILARKGRILWEEDRFSFRSKTEITEMVFQYQSMLQQIWAYIRKLERIKQIYEPFVSQKITSLFEKDDIRLLQPGDRTIVSAAILLIEANSFSDVASKSEMQEIFLYLDQSLQKMTQCVERENGIIIHHGNPGLTVLFPEGRERALRAAILMQKELQEMEIWHHGKQVIFGISLVYDKMLLQIVGNAERMDFAITSARKNMTVALQRLSEKYHTGILIDEQTFASMPYLSTQDGVRKWGEISEGFQAEECISVYEVFAAQKPEIVRLKILTKKDFEDGVNYFEQGQWEMARKCFIRVLQQNLDDRTAERYFTLCTEKLHQTKENGSNNEGWNVIEYYI